MSFILSILVPSKKNKSGNYISDTFWHSQSPTHGWFGCFFFFFFDRLCPLCPHWSFPLLPGSFSIKPPSFKFTLSRIGNETVLLLWGNWSSILLEVATIFNVILWSLLFKSGALTDISSVYFYLSDHFIPTLLSFLWSLSSQHLFWSPGEWLVGVGRRWPTLGEASLVDPASLVVSACIQARTCLERNSKHCSHETWRLRISWRPEMTPNSI